MVSQTIQSKNRIALFFMALLACALGCDSQDFSQLFQKTQSSQEVRAQEETEGERHQNHDEEITGTDVSDHQEKIAGLNLLCQNPVSDAGSVYVICALSAPVDESIQVRWNVNYDFSVIPEKEISTIKIQLPGDRVDDLMIEIEFFVDVSSGRDPVKLKTERISIAIEEDLSQDSNSESVPLIDKALVSHKVTPDSSPEEAEASVIPGNVLQVSAGTDHSCAIIAEPNTTSGPVKCWGRNGSGQLGLEHTTQTGDDPGEMGSGLKSVDLGSGRSAVQIDLGNYHSCALLDDGSVKCWGFNSKGELGQGHKQTLGRAAGDMGDALIPVDLGDGKKAAQVSAGQNHSCALLDDGTVKCWGYNGFGQLGINSTSQIGDNATEMGNALIPADFGSGVKAVEITTGKNHSCARLENGSVYCWGENGSGQLGQGHTDHIGDQPGETGNLLPINLGDGRKASRISAGSEHNCAILDNGTVKCWGANDYGQLGLGHSANLGDQPDEMGNALLTVDLGPDMTAVDIIAGRYHSCALLNTGKVKCWGRSDRGQLGLGNNLTVGNKANQMGQFLPETDLGSGQTVLQIASGYLHNCAILGDTRQLKCWGYNYFGQLGAGHSSNIGDDPGEVGVDLSVTNL